MQIPAFYFMQGEIDLCYPTLTRTVTKDERISRLPGYEHPSMSAHHLP